MQRKNKTLRYMKRILATFCLVFLLFPATAQADDDIEYYKVRSGDTLYSLSRKSGASIELISAINDIDPQAVLAVGQTVLLPHDPSIAVTVQKGDTLWSIAEEYGIAVDFLMNYNKINNAKNLYVGQTLSIPCPNLNEEPQSVSVVAAAVNKADFTVSTRKVTLSSRQGDNITWLKPLAGVISSDYGKRRSGFHHGVDIAAKKGSDIAAAAGGKVTFAGYKNYIYGNAVVIEHDGGYTTLYAHMSSISVNKGDVVKAGKIIGKVGSTGNATGPHLHFQISKNGEIVDPNKYVSLR